MNVEILSISTGQAVEATIRKAQPIELPSMHLGWRFNFDKQMKRLANATAYVLVTDESPHIIEGCLIFQMLDKQIPYMAFVEIAPHNKRTDKRHDHVGGCLIAFAFKQSFIRGKDDYQGLLMFDVSEEDPEDQTKLMAVYSKKYNAVKVDETTMYIMDEGGHQLIERYLNENPEKL